jgi:hypothetical protein
VCCGTKRVTEIACPPGCGYLTSARAHPPAVQQRQQDRDLQFLGALIDGLTQSQSELFLFVQAFLMRHAPGQLPPLLDADVAEAAAAAAATAETHAKGIIYEHAVANVPAQRLLVALRAAIDDLVNRSGHDVAPTRLQRDLAAVLRRIERGARTAAAALGEPDHQTSFLELTARILRDMPRPEASSNEGQAALDAEPRIIVP